MPCFAKLHRRGPTASRTHTSKHSRAKTVAKHTGQRAIDDSRATQIQTALIKSGYLSGEASGHWDANTETALRKFQGDNGWQTKITPDSRAIIKLGLGPNAHSELTASTFSTSASSAPGSSFLQK
ncbi:MAG: peptidoglycan-binding domain-containing protein [Edaphobacter sp.]